MVKPRERNTRFVDAVMTIPKGTLYPMCGMNLAFDRELIGPAMYFGLMGEGQPIGRYDDMWAGWCSKVRQEAGGALVPGLMMLTCDDLGKWRGVLAGMKQLRHWPLCLVVAAVPHSAAISR